MATVKGPRLAAGQRDSFLAPKMSGIRVEARLKGGFEMIGAGEIHIVIKLRQYLLGGKVNGSNVKGAVGLFISDSFIKLPGTLVGNIGRAHISEGAIFVESNISVGEGELVIAATDA